MKKNIWFPDGMLKEAIETYSELGFDVAICSRFQNVHSLPSGKGDNYFVVSHPSLSPFIEKLEAKGCFILGLGAMTVEGDKLRIKEQLERGGVSTPPYIELERVDYEEKLHSFWNRHKRGTAFMLKAALSHGSNGVALVRSPREVREMLVKAFGGASRLYIEPFIEGKDIAVSLVGEEKPFPLPIAEICHGGAYFDRELKRGAFSLKLFAEIDDAARRRIIDTVMKAWHIIQGHGVIRFDLRITSEGIPHVLEAVPFAEGMSPHHFSTRCARHIGLTFPRLLLKLVDLSHSRRRRKQCLP